MYDILNNIHTNIHMNTLTHNNTRPLGATNMNAVSSRSHAVFTVTVDVLYDVDASEETTRNMKAKLHLVDLAGKCLGQ